MKTNFILTVLTTSILLLHTGLSLAVENKADSTQEVSTKANVSASNGKADKGAKRKAAAKIKLVNINGATREELKKLPSIGDLEADKIIAGRPYATKAHLVTQKVIDRGVYEKIRKLIVAKQPYNDMNKNAALYNKRK